MQLDVRLKGITIGRTLREQIVDHLDAAFRRLSNRIRAVTVCLADTNGPRGGVDKNCQIAVQLQSGWHDTQRPHRRRLDRRDQSGYRPSDPCGCPKIGAEAETGRADEIVDSVRGLNCTRP